MYPLRKTKIICTIGPSTSTYEMLMKMYIAGMNVVRLNMSHGTHAAHEKVIRSIKNVNQKIKDSIPVLMDLEGPEIRTGTLKNDLQPGEIGEFLKIWTEVEEQLVGQAKNITARVFSVREALNLLGKSKVIPKELMFETDVIRRFRNQLVHKPKTIEPAEVQSFISRIRNIQIQLKNLISAF